MGMGIPRADAVFRPVDFEAYVGRHRIFVEGVRPEQSCSSGAPTGNLLPRNFNKV